MSLVTHERLLMAFQRLIAHRFPSADLETIFLVEYGQTFVSQRRVAAYMALAIWSAFFLWDWVQFHAFSREAFIYLVTIRLSGITFFLLLLWISWKPAFSDDLYATEWMLGGVAVAWFGLLLHDADCPTEQHLSRILSRTIACLLFSFNIFENPS